jgi:hypothetical protein
LSSQTSAVAVNAAHADVTAFTAALATRVEAHADHVSVADVRYIANEAESAEKLACLIDPVSGV